MFSKHPGDESTETQHPWGWDGMSLATMRSPVAEDEYIPHEIEDHGVREAWAAAFVASAKADGAKARCAVRSDCFVATSTGTDDAVFDLSTYICEANGAAGIAIGPADASTVNLRGKRQRPTPVALKRILSTTDGHGHKLMKWCKADKPRLP